MYSQKIHIGILEDLTPDFVTIIENNKTTKLKLSNVEVLTPDEISQWKVQHLNLKTFDVSVIFPENSNPDLIASHIAKMDGVFEAQVLDIYHGKQIPEGWLSITISYQVTDSQLRLEVENFLQGFGGIIR